MPGPRDGFELAAWIAAHHPALPVILTSGVPNMREAAAYPNVCEFVPKPYDFDALAARFREITARAAG
jgi:DNA-binding NtrC family response regulator